MKKEQYEKLLADNNKKLLVQDRYNMFFDSEVFEKNRATIKMKDNVSLQDIMKFSNMIWKEHGITSSLQSGSLRIYCTKNNLSFDFAQKLKNEYKNYIKVLYTDYKYEAPYNVMKALKKGESQSNANKLTEDNVKNNDKKSKEKENKNNNNNKNENNKKQQEKRDLTSRVVFASHFCEEDQMKAVAEELKLTFCNMVQNKEGVAVFKFNNEEDAAFAGLYQMGQRYTSTKSGLCIFFGDHPKLKNNNNKNDQQQ